MTDLGRYLAAYILNFFRERVTARDFEQETIFRVALTGAPSEALRAAIARLFPKAEIRPTEVGRAPVIVIPMTGGAASRFWALLGPARHKLLAPSPDYIYRFGMRQGVWALLWAGFDRLLLWPLALLRLGISLLWMYATGLAQASGAAQEGIGRSK